MIKKTKKSKKVIKNLVGRPTKYKKEFIQMMFDYFHKSPVDINGESIEFPTMDKFSADIGVNTDTLVEWSSAMKDGKLKHPKFSATYRQCKAFQKHILISNALKGKYASNFAIFVAVNMTDMIDKKEIDATSNGETIGGFNYVIPKDPDANSNEDIPDTKSDV